MITDLPDELSIAIFAHLDNYALVQSLSLVCHEWYRLAFHPNTWQNRRAVCSASYDNAESLVRFVNACNLHQIQLRNDNCVTHVLLHSVHSLRSLHIDLPATPHENAFCNVVYEMARQSLDNLHDLSLKNSPRVLTNKLLQLGQFSITDLSLYDYPNAADLADLEELVLGLTNLKHLRLYIPDMINTSLLEELVSTVSLETLAVSLSNTSIITPNTWYHLSRPLHRNLTELELTNVKTLSFPVDLPPLYLKKLIVNGKLNNGNLEDLLICTMKTLTSLTLISLGNHDLRISDPSLCFDNLTELTIWRTNASSVWSILSMCNADCLRKLNLFGISNNMRGVKENITFSNLSEVSFTNVMHDFFSAVASTRELTVVDCKFSQSDNEQFRVLSKFTRLTRYTGQSTLLANMPSQVIAGLRYLRLDNTKDKSLASALQSCRSLVEVKFTATSKVGNFATLLKHCPQLESIGGCGISVYSLQSAQPHHALCELSIDLSNMSVCELQYLFSNVPNLVKLVSPGFISLQVLSVLIDLIQVNTNLAHVELSVGSSGNFDDISCSFLSRGLRSAKLTLTNRLNFDEMMLAAVAFLHSSPYSHTLEMASSRFGFLGAKILEDPEAEAHELYPSILSQLRQISDEKRNEMLQSYQPEATLPTCIQSLILSLEALIAQLL